MELPLSINVSPEQITDILAKHYCLELGLAGTFDVHMSYSAAVSKCEPDATIELQSVTIVIDKHVPATT